jgi:predicted transcriptional regulator
MNINQLIILNWITRNVGLSFTEIKNKGKFSDGNLSSHLKALKQEKLIKEHKSFFDNKSHTLYTNTSAGKKFLLAFDNMYYERGRFK